MVEKHIIKIYWRPAKVEKSKEENDYANKLLSIIFGCQTEQAVEDTENKINAVHENDDEYHNDNINTEDQIDPELYAITNLQNLLNNKYCCRRGHAAIS